MEFKSQHIQPFTLEQAALLDTPVITAEISRLQNSLMHLHDTQMQLQETIDLGEELDFEILQALEENKQVIFSQDERVLMLRVALERKGLTERTNPHYDPPLRSDTHPEAAGVEIISGNSESTSDGVYL